MKTTMPRLSDQLDEHNADLGCCQECGRESDIVQLTVWIEMGDDDKPESPWRQKLVVLCKACSDHSIECHPRLYRAKDTHEPLPGAMPCCMECSKREGWRCKSTLLRANGGAGLPLKFPRPLQVHINRGSARKNSWETIWQGPVSCDDQSIRKESEEVTL